MKTAVAIFVVLSCTGGAMGVLRAQEVSVTFTREEVQAAIQLWDAGLKSVGGPAAKAYVVLTEKINTAQQQTPPAKLEKPQ